MQVGVLDYAKDVLDVDTLVHDSVETVQQTMATHTIVVSGTSSRKIIGDRERLKQVFINLLSNAIKYSTQVDKVNVTITAGEDKMTVSIRDYGVGIPSADQPRIFERFYRVLDSGEKKVSGLGMGLYIVHEIIQQHSGQVWLESTEGEGSVFYVSLPTLCTSLEPCRHRSRPKPDQGASTMSVDGSKELVKPDSSIPGAMTT